MPLFKKKMVTTHIRSLFYSIVLVNLHMNPMVILHINYSIYSMHYIV